MVATGIRRYLLALMFAGGLTSPAAADVIYSFDQTSFSGTCSFGLGPVPCVPSPAPTIHFTIEVTDSAAQNGFSIFQHADFNSAAAQPEAPLDLTGTGIVRIAFQVQASPVGSVIQSGPGFNSFSSLGSAPPYFNPGWFVSLLGGPNGVGGHLEFLGLEDDFTFDLSPTGSASGTFVTDNPYVVGCHYSPGCSFAGVMTVSTPEPASLGLLTFGVAGLLLMRPRGKRAAK